MPPKKTQSAPTEGTRKSSRIADKPAPPAPKSVPKKKATSKRTKKDDEDDEEAPKAKKAKGDSSAEEEADKKEESEDAIAEPPTEPLSEQIPEETEQAVESGDEPPAAVKELVTGDILPDITLKNEKGEDVNVKDLAGETQGVVFFLVPKADTPGCTTQACGFRDLYPDFTGVDYSVYCVSADASIAQAKWQTKKQLPYPLLSDPKHVFIKALGAFKSPKSTKRSHFIFEKGTGKLIESKVLVKPAESPKQALAFIKAHHV